MNIGTNSKKRKTCIYYLNLKKGEKGERKKGDNRQETTDRRKETGERKRKR
jgi:hypothetical protein